jgi:hypothetical protein
MNSVTPRSTNPAILRVFLLCFLDVEVLSRAVDPSEVFEVVFDGGGDLERGDGRVGASVGFELGSGDVGVGADFGPAGAGIGAGPTDGEGSDADGAMLVLNGFPSFLHSNTVSHLTYH